MKVIRPFAKELIFKKALVYLTIIGIYKLSVLQSVQAFNKSKSVSSVISPKLLIFHLDKVIWKFAIDEVDKEVQMNTSRNVVTDNSGNVLQVHTQVLDLLKSLISQRFKLGAISLCPNIELVDRLMYLLSLDKYIMFQEFFYGAKVNHIEKIKRMCDIPYNEIVYFDYTAHGFSEIEERGIITLKVQEDIGLTQEDINKGLQIYRENLD